MRLRWPIFAASLGAFIAACGPNSQRRYDLQAAPNFLFEQRPFRLECADRTPGQPLPSGTRAIVVISPQASYLRTRLETLELPRTDIPALTIAADPSNSIDIAGGNRDDWSLQFCAQGEGDSETDARDFLREISMARVGSLVTLNGAGPGGRTGGRGNLLVDAPADAPITVHASFGAVEVHNMSAPVRVTAVHARATILNTTGRVDAAGFVVDFAGSTGTVILSAEAEINVKLTSTRFQGSLNAWAQRPVRVLLPRAFQTPFQAVVNRPKDFVCRTDFCSKVRSEKDGALYVFTYAGDGSAPPGRIHFRSEQATVVIDASD